MLPDEGISAQALGLVQLARATVRRKYIEGPAGRWQRKVPAGRSFGMRTQLRPELAGFDKRQSEHGDFLGFKMSP